MDMHPALSQRHYAIILGILLALPTGLNAATMDLSDVPLNVSNAVEPNIMLLLDSSGSMDNIIWHTPETDGYNPSSTYDYWCGQTCTDADPDLWDPTETYMTISSINDSNADGSCTTSNPLDPITVIDPTTGQSISLPRYVVQGINSAGTTKCLILPDILGKGTTRYTGHYLNYLFQKFTDGDDLSTIIPINTRMQVMQSVTIDLVTNTSGMRFGVSEFNGGSGADILVGCDSKSDSHDTAIENSIDGLKSSGSTPLAESLYEITRYFRGLRGRYRHTGSRFETPIEYRCQKNYAITLTDGLPTSDELNVSPSSDPDIQSDCDSDSDAKPPCLPNWDRLVNTASSATNPPSFSDGTGTGNEGKTMYLDDVAKFAYELDLLEDPPKPAAPPLHRTAPVSVMTRTRLTRNKPLKP